MIHHRFEELEGTFDVYFSKSNRTIHVWIVLPNNETINDAIDYESQTAIDGIFDGLKDFEDHLVTLILKHAKETYKEGTHDK